MTLFVAMPFYYRRMYVRGAFVSTADIVTLVLSSDAGNAFATAETEDWN